MPGQFGFVHRPRKSEVVATAAGVVMAVALAVVQGIVGVGPRFAADQPDPALILTGLLVVLLGGTLLAIAGVVRDVPAASVAGWYLLLLVAAGYVVPWLLGDRLVQYDNIMRPWAALPIAAFMLSRLYSGRMSTLESKSWNGVVAVSVLFSVVVLVGSFALGGNPFTMPIRDSLVFVGLLVVLGAHVEYVRRPRILKGGDPDFG